MKALELISTLEEQAAEIASHGLSGWGNTMTLAAAELRRLAAVEAERDALKVELEAEREESKRWLVKAQNERDARKELEAELERIKALPPVAWRSSMGHGVTLKETLTDDQKALTWDGKPMWQPLYALGSKTDE